jgi:hypothetical protein
MPDAYGGENGMVSYSPAEAGMSEGDIRRAGAREGLKTGAMGAATGAATGAAAGAAIGSAVGPWGTAIGAGLGAIGGAIGGGIKGKRAAKAQRKKERAWAAAQKRLAEERYQARKQAHNLVKLAYNPANEQFKRMYGQHRGLDLDQTPWGHAPAAVPAGAQDGTPDTWSPDQYGPPKGGQSYWGTQPRGGATTPPLVTRPGATKNTEKPEGAGKGGRKPNAKSGK